MSTIRARSLHAGADETEADARWRQVVGGLHDRIKPVRVGILYQFGLLLVAAMMVLLPAAYVALIFLAGMGVYWYAIHATVMFEAVGSGAMRGGGRVMLLLLIAYVGPLISGGILVFFMIKPLFAKRADSRHPLSLARSAEPLLFGYVDRLCEVVGSPKPTRIDVDTQVNASASFGSGFWGFIRKDLVLTIGLPLVAGMDLRQVTGVLAHEFGHFAQGTGMRITFLIRSINHWFARVVYQRDAWDQWLINASNSAEHWSITLVVALSRLFVWLTRRILWLLMMIGHGVSSFMLRQMEFDADRYEARVTGSASFAPTMEKIELLSIASRAAFNDLESAWREKRLCDDLPSLIRSREPDIPSEIRLAITEHNKKGKTGWLDTHPAHADRVRSAARENAPGIFAVELPATILFSNFRDISCRATVAFYHQALGKAVKPQHIVATDAMVEKREKGRENSQALTRFFQGLIHPVRPVFPAGLSTPPSGDSAAETLLEMRCKLTDALPRAREAAQAFEQADGRMLAVSIARALRNAHERIDIKAMKFKSGADDELAATLKIAELAEESARQTLAEVLSDAMLRLEIALSLEAKPVLAAVAQNSEDDYGEYDLVAEPQAGSGDRLLAALRALRSAAPITESLRQNFFPLGAVASRLRAEKNSPLLVDTVIARSGKVARDLGRLHAELVKTPYPYEHAEQGVSIGQFAVPIVPPVNRVGDMHTVAECALDGVYGLYERIVSDLAQRAEAIESSLGLPPLPDVTTPSKERPAS